MSYIMGMAAITVIEEARNGTVYFDSFPTVIEGKLLKGILSDHHSLSIA